MISFTLLCKYVYGCRLLVYCEAIRGFWISNTMCRLLSSIRDITWYFSVNYRSVSDISQRQVWSENAPPRIGGNGHWCHIVTDCVWHSNDGFLCSSWLVWFLACVWLWMKWIRVLSSCHIVFVVRWDQFHRKSWIQVLISSTPDIFIKLLNVQLISIWYTENLLFKLLDLIVKTPNPVQRTDSPIHV